MATPFPFDLNIERAATIPARLYTDPVFLELEQERVFGRTWQLVGRAADVTRSGQYFTTEIGGEAIVVVRDGDTLRGFHNVCLHRAGPVASGCGSRQTLQCKYHGWTYRLDGSLLRTPGMEDARHFAADEMHLVPLLVEAWGPLVFANLDLKAPPLAHFLEDLPARVAFDSGLTYSCIERREYDVACNWKVYVDNYLEGYHIPLVHPTLHKELDDKQYRVEPRRYYSIQHAPLRGAAAGDADRLYRPDAKQRVGPGTYWLFPNIMLNVYFGQLQTNVVLPRGPIARRSSSSGSRWTRASIPRATTGHVASPSATRSRTRTARSARSCNAISVRASTTGDATRRARSRASITSTRFYTSS